MADVGVEVESSGMSLTAEEQATVAPAEVRLGHNLIERVEWIGRRIEERVLF
ncbi:MAG: hypothetical protein ABSB24_07240 [Gaiellaceae bacterium]|jgi:hypothetical protein